MDSILTIILISVSLLFFNWLFYKINFPDLFLRKTSKYNTLIKVIILFLCLVAAGTYTEKVYIESKYLRLIVHSLFYGVFFGITLNLFRGKKPYK